MREGVEKTVYPNLGESVYTYKLSNGLELALIPKPEYKEILGMLAVRLGSLTSANTSPSMPAGLAHFLEHKLFEMPDGRDALQQFAALGADVNAFTSYHHTAYYFSTLERVRECLTLLHDMVDEIHITTESLERERHIIAQEIKMYEDEPDYQLYLSILQQLYPDSLLSKDIVGSQEDLAQLSADQLRTAFDRYYRPDQMLLCLVGKINVDSIIDMVDTIFTRESQTAFEGDSALTPDTRAVKSSGQMEMVVGSPKLAVGYRGKENLTGLSSLEYRIGLRLCFALIMGWTSSTYQDWYQKGRIDDSFTIDIEATKDYRYAIISLDTQEPITLSKHIQRRIRHFEQLPDMTTEHLDLLKKEMLGDTISSMNHLDFLANQYVASWAVGETIFDLPDVLDRLDLDKVLEIGRDFIDRAEVSEFMIFPK